MKSHLTHLDHAGAPRMVDVGRKRITARSAVARGSVWLPETCRQVLEDGGRVPKGDVLQVARLSGIMAAKRTSDLIPLCHPLPLTAVEVECTRVADRIAILARVRCHGRTGVEMEALTAVSAAALTIYDMLKALSHDIVIERIELVSKQGGASGPIRRRVPI